MILIFELAAFRTLLEQLGLIPTQPPLAPPLVPAVSMTMLAAPPLRPTTLVHSTAIILTAGEKPQQRLALHFIGMKDFGMLIPRTMVVWARYGCVSASQFQLLHHRAFSQN